MTKFNIIPHIRITIIDNIAPHVRLGKISSELYKYVQLSFRQVKMNALKDPIFNQVEDEYNLF